MRHLYYKKNNKIYTLPKILKLINTAMRYNHFNCCWKLEVNNMSDMQGIFNGVRTARFEIPLQLNLLSFVNCEDPAC